MKTLIVRDDSLKKQAYINMVESCSIEEGINREFVLNTVFILEDDKAQYIVKNAIIEIENNFFRIRELDKQKWAGAEKRFVIKAEHVSMSLIDDDLEYFASVGTAETILTSLLSGTGFTVGEVEVTGSYTVSIQEETNKRKVLIEVADVFGGELEFEKFTIHLRKRRGTDTGVQVRAEKNMQAINRIEEEIDGVIYTAYDIEIIELVEVYGDIEKIELGDTVRLIDKELGINENKRVVWRSYDPIKKRVSKIQVANFVQNLSDEIYQIKNKTLVKERLYNGVKVGPENGFEAVRSDNKARTVMNATEGIKIQKGDGTGGVWDDVIFLDTEGNAHFTGTVEASDFVGGSINIGNGNFTVNELGELFAASGEFRGDVVSGRVLSDTTIEVTTDLYVGNYIYVGDQSASVSKGISFSNLSYVEWDPNVGQLAINSPQTTIIGSGSQGTINLLAGNTIFIQGSVLIDLSGYAEYNGIEIATKADIDNAIAQHVANMH